MLRYNNDVPISEMSTKELWIFVAEPFIIWIVIFNRCAAIICTLLFIPCNKSKLFNWINKL